MDTEKVDIIKKIELLKALERLEKFSVDFKLVFKEYYLKEYALQLLYKKSTSNNELSLDSKLNSISLFNQFLSEIRTNGEIAIRDLKEYEEKNDD